MARNGLQGLRSFTGEKKSGTKNMLETIAIILVVLWLLGLVTSYTIGGFIHILLVAAIIIFVVRLLQGRRPL